MTTPPPPIANSTGLRIAADRLEEHGDDALAAMVRETAERLATFERMFWTYRLRGAWAMRNFEIRPQIRSARFFGRHDIVDQVEICGVWRALQGATIEVPMDGSARGGIVYTYDGTVAGRQE